MSVAAVPRTCLVWMILRVVVQWTGGQWLVSLGRATLRGWLGPVDCLAGGHVKFLGENGGRRHAESLQGVAMD